MSRLQRSCLLFLVVAACLPAGCKLKGSTEADPVPAAPPPPLPPILVREGSVGIPTAGSTSSASFAINATGTLRINLDWTVTGQETTLSARVWERSFEGPCAPGCEREDLCPSHCRKEVEGWVDLATHPATLRTTSSLKPSSYELHVSYYDPLDYLLPWHPNMAPRVAVSYQIFLNPASPGAAATPLE
jgi:hypothetical protein